jgi:hypothetical protein
VVGGRMIQPRIYKPQSRKFKVAGKKHLKWTHSGQQSGWWLSNLGVKNKWKSVK